MLVDILRDINITDYKSSTADTKKIRSEAPYRVEGMGMDTACK